MSEKDNNEKESLIDEELEKKLDILWENWSSRRACEQKHTPEYIKKQENT